MKRNLTMRNMNWTKIIGYMLIGVLFYSFIAFFISISPIFFNLIGVGFSNNFIIDQQRHYYKKAPMRSIFQGDAGCAQADKVLGYKFKYGDCNFKNFEFDTLLKFDENGALVNRDLKLISQSDVIVVGDSHAMGWGVDFNQTFSYLLNNLGYNVSNLSMSSYGTEQEILSAINSKKFLSADAVVIQYCENDISKNKKKIDDYVIQEFDYYSEIEKRELNFIKKIQNAARFYFNEWNLASFFGFPIHFLKSFYKKPHTYSTDAAEHKKYIKEILSRYDLLNDKNIIIFYSNAHGKKFINWNEVYGNIKFVDLNLDQNHYFQIDDHLNKEGHKYISFQIHELLSNLR